MQKLFAITCVIGWGVFYVFAYLALASVNDAQWMSVTYGLLAFAGFVAGMLSWVRLVRGKRPVIRTVPKGAARVRRPL
ncbi:hypothetical protein NHU_03792 [Rhodovulum sulfidophilum]|uniref:Uncharacterized protein n=1 Tax=Rhodovulum sulfidophilum TaxID=35806 RepID=A0A0D6B795_RHOSU|nr:hypothetical protein NHU_03792 [Rhodovulum sulfidophilum]